MPCRSGATNGQVHFTCKLCLEVVQAGRKLPTASLLQMLESQPVLFQHLQACSPGSKQSIFQEDCQKNSKYLTLGVVCR